MGINNQYQPRIKDVSGVLMGIAQIRVGLPSVRSGSTAVTKAVQAVGKSTLYTDSGGVTVVKSSPVYTANVGTGAPTVTGDYTGSVDGCFIVRMINGTTGTIYAPDGTAAAFSAIAPIATDPAEFQGLTFAGTLTTPAAGDTWVVPVWADSTAGLVKVQTGITSPFSMFSGDNESVGGLASSSFAPKIDEKKELFTGFPAVSADVMVTKTSCTISFSAYEYNNANMAYLKNMVSSVINDAQMVAVPIEVVMMKKSGDLVTFWCPSCSLDTMPTYSPIDDYSKFDWAFTANKMTEITGAADTYNGFLRNTQVFYELTYKH